MRNIALLFLATGLAFITNADARTIVRQPIALPTSVAQGQLVIGSVFPGSQVSIRDLPDGGVSQEAQPETALMVMPDGMVVFGIGRDEAGLKRINVTFPDGPTEALNIVIKPREFKIENITDVPQDTVTPPPEIAARIER